MLDIRALEPLNSIMATPRDVSIHIGQTQFSFHIFPGDEQRVGELFARAAKHIYPHISPEDYKKL